MTVNWTESALADLQAIESYLARHSPKYFGLKKGVVSYTLVLNCHNIVGTFGVQV